MASLKFTKNNINEQTNEDREEQDQLVPDLMSMLADDARMVGLYGEVNEENCRTLISHLYSIHIMDQKKLNTPDDEGVIIEPIEMLVSTEGGAVTEMFSTIDVMSNIMKTCEIHTIGLGKVMSAGILLLANGTKGKRKVGKYTRLMLHSISGGDFGSIKQLENNIKEVKWYQDNYIKALSECSDLSSRQLKAIFRKKSDTYFDAEQAIKWGIADEII
jgi:ATP-dependent Clp endopeptidase proteolytic subunit ClpP